MRHGVRASVVGVAGAVLVALGSGSALAAPGPPTVPPTPVVGPTVAPTPAAGPTSPTSPTGPTRPVPTPTRRGGHGPASPSPVTTTPPVLPTTPPAPTAAPTAPAGVVLRVAADAGAAVAAAVASAQAAAPETPAVPSAAPLAGTSFYTDSLGVAAEPYLTSGSISTSIPGPVHVYAARGWSPCQFDRIRSPRTNFRRTFEADRPATVVFAFSGNYSAWCYPGVTDADQLAAAYRADLAEMAGYAIRAGAKVRFVEPITMSPRRDLARYPYNGAPALGRMYCELAATSGGRAACEPYAVDTLTPGGVFRQSIDGVPQRTADGVHLTYGPGVAEPSGGLLYAAALARSAS